MQVEGQLFFDPEGVPVRQLGIVKDITEKKKTEADLIKTHQRLEIALGAGNLGSYEWEISTGQIECSNTCKNNFFLKAGEELTMDKLVSLILPEDRFLMQDQIQKAILEKNIYNAEYRILAPDQSIRWISAAGVPVYNKDGQAVQIIGVTSDITHKKRGEEDLRLTNERLRLLVNELELHEQQKDDFIKMASHELKTPLTTIKGYAQLLLNMTSGSSDAFLLSSLSTIDKQVSKLTKLVSHLLDVTKIETGKVHLTREVSPMGEIIRDIVRDIQTTTPTHSILVNEIQNPSVRVDKDRIQQVIANLITNAIKYSPGADKVLIDVDLDGDAVVVAVRDFGIGISEEDYEKIFERFYRVEGKNEKTFPGFGIGLYIVQEILTLHEGKIWVESEPATGSVFYFSLPVYQDIQTGVVSS